MVGLRGSWYCGGVWPGDRRESLVSIHQGFQLSLGVLVDEPWIFLLISVDSPVPLM
jgi:hypothetical protein